ncbi:MAG: DMT family transporter [Bacteroidia bacterium]|nr:DMT family transporter [Bacteroidia bacterium]
MKPAADTPAAAAFTRPAAHGALMLVAWMYGVNYFVAQEVFAAVPPLAMTAVRSFAGAACFFLAERLLVRERIRERGDYVLLFWCALTGAGLNQLFFLWGLSKTLAVNAAVLMTLSPVFVFVTAALLRTEAITPVKAAGLLLAFGGALYLALGGRKTAFSSQTLAGDLMILLNAALYGVYLVIVKPLTGRYHPFTILKWIFAFGALINIPAGLPQLVSVPWTGLPGSVWLGILFVVGAATLGVYALNSWALKHISSAAVGIYIYLQPVITALLTVLWKRQPLYAYQVWCMLLVSAGVFAVSMRRKRS